MGAVDKGRTVVYPGFWRFIMLIIKHIPEGIFIVDTVMTACNSP